MILKKIGLWPHFWKICPLWGEHSQPRYRIFCTSFYIIISFVMDLYLRKIMVLRYGLTLKFTGFRKTAGFENLLVQKELWIASKNIRNEFHKVKKQCSLRNGPHKLFQAKSLTTFDFLSNALIARFFNLKPIFLELPLIISSVTECPIFVCFCFGSNYEKFLLIQPTRMLDPLWLMKLSTKSLKI